MSTNSDRVATDPSGRFKSGVCRICGCTEKTPCTDDYGQPCTWMDAAHTLCDNLDCIGQVPIGELEAMISEAA